MTGPQNTNFKKPWKDLLHHLNKHAVLFVAYCVFLVVDYATVFLGELAFKHVGGETAFVTIWLSYVKPGLVLLFIVSFIVHFTKAMYETIKVITKS